MLGLEVELELGLELDVLDEVEELLVVVEEATLEVVVLSLVEDVVVLSLDGLVDSLLLEVEAGL